MTDSLTQALADFVAKPPFQQVPQDVLPLLRNAFVDTVACLFTGKNEPVTQSALRLARERGSCAQVQTLMGSEKLSVMDAAMVNAVSAHALDYDDMALNGHPSVVLVPALLAVGEVSGVSDDALLRAYLVGYEVWAELVGREPDSLHNKGWHPTSVIGTVAVAAAVAHLEGLSSLQARQSLGIAASMASGLMGNFGSMTKPLHAGWAAAHGIEAVRLAQFGVSASAQVLESPVGFLAALSPQGKVDRKKSVDFTELRVRRNGLSIKKYPVCYAAHRVIDGVLALKREHGLTADQVKCVTPVLSEVTARVLHSHRPGSGLEAKFSVEFACAMAVVEGAVGLSQVTDEQVRRADIQALLERVAPQTVEADCPIEPGFAMHDSVKIELLDGRVLHSGPIRFAKGHARLALSEAEVKAKWLDCLKSVGESRESLLQQLQQLAESAEHSVCRWLKNEGIAQAQAGLCSQERRSAEGGADPVSV